MSESVSHFKTERGSDRSFGVVFALFFFAVAVFPFFTKGEIGYWALGLSGAFAVIAWVYPKLLTPLNNVWFKLGMLLSAIIAPLVMVVIFFLVITPLGFVLRFLGKDPLRLKKDTQQDTYWTVRSQDNNEFRSMKNQF